MRKVTYIENEQLVFDSSQSKQNPFFKQKSFRLPVNKIKVIGYKRGTFFDDDYAVYIFIDDNSRQYFLSEDIVHRTDIFSQLKEYVKINFELIELLPKGKKYSKEKIIFPEEFSDTPLFSHSIELNNILLFIKKIMTIENYASGVLSQQLTQKLTF